jgi:hypothetical protein
MQKEKEIVQNIFSKESIHSFEEQVNAVPENYFEQFPTMVLSKIQQKKKPTLIVQLGRFSIAAAFIIIIAGAYFFNANNTIEKTSIALHEIPTEEIDSYVSNNEWMADAEMQTEFNKLGLNLDIDIRSNDSID